MTPKWLEAVIDQRGYPQELWLYDTDKVSRANKPIPLALHDLLPIQTVNTKTVQRKPPFTTISLFLPCLIRQKDDGETA